MNRPSTDYNSLTIVLGRVYHDRLDRVIKSLHSMGPRYYFRINTLRSSRSRIQSEMRGQGIDARLDETVQEAAFIPASEHSPLPRGVSVQADRFAAESVLQGAHLYAPGVRRCHGLRAGSSATVTDQFGVVVGVGVARQSETSILTYRQGIAVEVKENRFRLPSLMDKVWYEKGEIHLQSLPAMVTCLVLDPKPGETIVDMNCAPGGKLAHICQSTDNQAKIIGFDRNARKVEKARKQLERLGCQNYRLVNHDSRYAHTDFSLKADRVLVDPPCTGLGVTPKLSVTTRERDVENLASYQKQFLSAAKRIVKPGGTVVYSVCTITGEECEDVARFAIEHCGLKLEEASPIIGRPGHDPQGLTQRFDPELDWLGYFIAKFTKT